MGSIGCPRAWNTSVVAGFGGASRVGCGSYPSGGSANYFMEIWFGMPALRFGGHGGVGPLGQCGWTRFGVIE